MGGLVEAVISLLLKELPAAMPAIGLAILLGYGGRYAVPMVRCRPASRWRTAYLESTWAHPIIIGALVGLSPELPVPSWMGDSWEASIIWYALAGVVSVPLYRRLMQRLERKDGAA